jgi:hypothetical protein
VSNKGGTFLELFRLWGRESWWIGTDVGVEPSFGVAKCGEQIGRGPDLLMDS